MTTNKEKKLRQREREAISRKANFIMKHSAELLEKINKNDETFLRCFVAFLMTNSNDDFETGYDENEYDYEQSLTIIFKICYELPSLGFSVEESQNIRNKLRLYTKHFVEDKETKNKYVLIDGDEYERIAGIQKSLTK